MQMRNYENRAQFPAQLGSQNGSQNGSQSGSQHEPQSGLELRNKPIQQPIQQPMQLDFLNGSTLTSAETSSTAVMPSTATASGLRTPEFNPAFDYTNSKQRKKSVRNSIPNHPVSAKQTNAKQQDRVGRMSSCTSKQIKKFDYITSRPALDRNMHLADQLAKTLAGRGKYSQTKAKLSDGQRRQFGHAICGHLLASLRSQRSSQ